MRLRDVMLITKAQAFTSNIDPECEIRNGFAADLMSDVLCYDVAHGLMLSGLASHQMVRTAEMADIVAVLLVRDKKPPLEIIELAEQLGIALLGTDKIMFETCGRLFAAGLPACHRRTEHDR